MCNFNGKNSLILAPPSLGNYSVRNGKETQTHTLSITEASFTLEINQLIILCERLLLNNLALKQMDYFELNYNLQGKTIIQI